MIVEIIPEGGLLARPVRMLCQQVVIRQDNGTPICVAAVYGPDGAVALSCVGMADFNRTLHNLGIKTVVLCDTLELPKPPPGARLIAGPKG